MKMLQTMIGLLILAMPLCVRADHVDDTVTGEDALYGFLYTFQWKALDWQPWELGLKISRWLRIYCNNNTRKEMLDLWNQVKKSELTRKTRKRMKTDDQKIECLQNHIPFKSIRNAMDKFTKMGDVTYSIRQKYGKLAKILWTWKWHKRIAEKHWHFIYELSLRYIRKMLQLGTLHNQKKIPRLNKKIDDFIRPQLNSDMFDFFWNTVLRGCTNVDPKKPVFIINHEKVQLAAQDSRCQQFLKVIRGVFEIAREELEEYAETDDRPVGACLMATEADYPFRRYLRDRYLLVDQTGNLQTIIQETEESEPLIPKCDGKIDFHNPWDASHPDSDFTPTFQIMEDQRFSREVTEEKENSETEMHVPEDEVHVSRSDSASPLEVPASKDNNTCTPEIEDEDKSLTEVSAENEASRGEHDSTCTSPSEAKLENSETIPERLSNVRLSSLKIRLKIAAEIAKINSFLSSDDGCLNGIAKDNIVQQNSSPR